MKKTTKRKQQRQQPLPPATGLVLPPKTDAYLRLNAFMDALREEMVAAIKKHAPMHSPHEGYAVIREELDELWEHVKRDTGRSKGAVKEAMQVAAMGLRYAVDLSAPRVIAPASLKKHAATMRKIAKRE